MEELIHNHRDGITKIHPYIANLINLNPEKYNIHTHFIWIGKTLSHVVEFTLEYYENWILNLFRPYGLDFTALPYGLPYDKYPRPSISNFSILLFATEGLYSDFMQKREITEKIRILMANNILKRDICINFTCSFVDSKPNSLFSNLDNFDILSQELSFLKHNYRMGEFIEDIKVKLIQIGFTIFRFYDECSYIVIYKRFLVDGFNIKRNSNSLLDHMYKLSKNGGTSLYTITSKTGKEFQFDSVLLEVNSNFFKAKINSGMEGTSTNEMKFLSQSLDYFHMYCYRFQYKISEETKKLHDFADVDECEISDYHLNYSEHFRRKMPYNMVNWLPEGFKLSEIMDLFVMMDYYAIDDEQFGLELLAIVMENIRDFEAPLEFINEIKNIPSNSGWIIYNNRLSELIEVVEMGVKSGVFDG